MITLRTITALAESMARSYLMALLVIIPLNLLALAIAIWGLRWLLLAAWQTSLPWEHRQVVFWQKLHTL